MKEQAMEVLRTIRPNAARMLGAVIGAAATWFSPWTIICPL